MYEAIRHLIDSYVNPPTQEDYQLAIQKGIRRKFASQIKGENNHLLSLSDYLRCYRISAWRDEGVQAVAIDAIKGSLHRSQDFDNAFMPCREQTCIRWMSIDGAYHQRKTLLPVNLWRVGEIYFVIDGHHRISVASLHGQSFIDAFVKNIEINEQC